MNISVDLYFRFSADFPCIFALLYPSLSTILLSSDVAWTVLSRRSFCIPPVLSNALIVQPFPFLRWFFPYYGPILQDSAHHRCVFWRRFLRSCVVFPGLAAFWVEIGWRWSSWDWSSAFQCAHLHTQWVSCAGEKEKVLGWVGNPDWWTWTNSSNSCESTYPPVPHASSCEPRSASIESLLAVILHSPSKKATNKITSHSCKIIWWGWCGCGWQKDGCSECESER